MNKISNYTRPPQWAEDFGEPLENCHEVNVDGNGNRVGDGGSGSGTGIFQRRWSKATVTWNCSAQGSANSGAIIRTP